MSRAFKGYASNYRADQVQTCRVRRTQKRTVVVDFAAMLPGNAAIGSVTFECNAPWITVLSNAAINVEGNAKEASVVVEFNYAGRGNVKATATFIDGSKANYEFAFTVADAPMYPSATYSAAAGPYSLTATN